MTLTRLCGIGIVVLVASAATGAQSQDKRHFVGGGVNYLKTVGDIKDDNDWDSDALSYVGSYQFKANRALKLAAEIEYVPDVGPNDDAVWQPQGYLLLGSSIYAGAGIGIGYIDGEWNDDPFYALRAGLELPLGRILFLDINANYRFVKMSALEDLDSDDADQVTFGAALRIAL